MLNERDVITNYPYPIVATYLQAQRAITRRSAGEQEKITGLMRLAEAIIEYAAALVIAQYCTYGVEVEGVERLLHQFARHPTNVTLKLWTEMLRQGVEALALSKFEDETVFPSAFRREVCQGALLKLYETVRVLVPSSIGERPDEVTCFDVMDALAQFQGIVRSNSLSRHELADLAYRDLLAGMRALLEKMSFVSQYILVYIESATSSDNEFLHEARLAMGAGLVGQEPVACRHPLKSDHFYILVPDQSDPLLCLGPLLIYEDGDVFIAPESARRQLRYLDSPRRRSMFELIPQKKIDKYSQAVGNALDNGDIAESHRQALESLATTLGIPPWRAEQIEEALRSGEGVHQTVSPSDRPHVEWEQTVDQPIRKLCMGRLADWPHVWVVTSGEDYSSDALYLVEKDAAPQLIVNLNSLAETLACSENGATMAVGCWNGQISVFDREGRPRRGPPNLGNVVKAVALSPDGSKLAATTWGELALLFDIANNTTLRELQLPDAGQSIALGAGVEISDEEEKAGSEETPTVRFSSDWRIQLRENITASFDDEELRTLCFDLGLQYDNLRGEGKAAKVRELITRLERTKHMDELLALVQSRRPEIPWKGPTPPQSEPNREASSRSSPTRSMDRVAVGTYNGVISVFDSEDDAVWSDEIGDSVVHLALAEGNRVIAACADGRITGLSSEDWNRRLYRVSGAIDDVAASRDGRKIVIAHSRRQLAFLNDTGGQLRPAHPRDPRLDSDIVRLAVSDDGRWCFAITQLGSLHIFEEIHHRARWSLDKTPVDLAISADARRVAVAFEDRTVQVLSLPTTLVPSVEPRIEILSISPPSLSCSRLSVVEIELRNIGNGVAREISADVSGSIDVRSIPVLQSLRPDETKKLSFNARASDPGTLLLRFEITYRDDSGGLRSEISFIDEYGTSRTGTHYTKKFEAMQGAI